MAFLKPLILQLVSVVHKIVSYKLNITAVGTISKIEVIQYNFLKRY